MTTASELRTQFFEFFRSRGHKIVESAPIVVKNDPSLMFTNAGMNQFKDYFLGNKKAVDKRVADTQKCLRVSGKHNDLEEVGVDTYHHTMFEMLGNWSFGDYFKRDAIAWAWELLTEVYQLDKDRLYVTIFEGDASDGLQEDSEAAEFWKQHISEDRIIQCDKKDNFWEMGDTGPCGPCSEIHMDLRPDSERAKKDGRSLVNMDHDQVIELWNLVFIQYNRKADGSLESLPEKHVDTGMGLERVVRAVNLESSNYNTDLFMDTIAQLEKISGKSYGKDEQVDIAFRVIADHLRAVSFTIADGQLPSNEKAGYVVRRILRRAIRYGYSFLDLVDPFIFSLVDGLAEKFKDVFPEVIGQKDFIKNVIKQEEKAFLLTLKSGVEIFTDEALKTIEFFGSTDAIKAHTKDSKSITEQLKKAFGPLKSDSANEKLKVLTKVMKENFGALKEVVDSNSLKIPGQTVFKLQDTHGFPKDLTQLMAHEIMLDIDEEGYNLALQEQKNRSRADAQKEEGDWQVILDDEREEFVGYDYTETEVKITRYREVKVKNKTQYHLVFHLTPFYGESGGQVGDAGYIEGQKSGEKVSIVNTIKENNLIIHIADKLPSDISQAFNAKVDNKKRKLTTYNHSATHLLHAALKTVLGEHVNQKGSLVNEKHLRFDFSHFQKVSDEELARIEKMVNSKIREAIPLVEERAVPYKKALEKGAMALFGEKYGDVVRVITFDPEFSVELCGGTHVANTAEIGSLKIVAESSVAAGVRRIEAITADKAQQYVEERLTQVEQIHDLLGGPKDLIQAVEQLLADQKDLRAKISAFEDKAAQQVKLQLKQAAAGDDFTRIIEIVELSNAAQAKDLCFQLKNEYPSLFCVLIADIGGKPSISIMISDDLVETKELNAGQLVREWAKHVRGGGGGQAFFAQAGGSDVSGLAKVKQVAEEFIDSI